MSTMLGGSGDGAPFLDGNHVITMSLSVMLVVLHVKRTVERAMSVT
jgi:hypothetical protein